MRPSSLLSLRSSSLPHQHLSPSPWKHILCSAFHLVGKSSRSHLPASVCPWSRRRTCRPCWFSSETSTPTLFDLPALSRPADFLRLSHDAIRNCDSIRRQLASSLSHNEGDTDNDGQTLQRAQHTLHLLDDISNIVCTAIDAAELCRSVHACPEWRRSASDAFGILSDYIGTLNADECLYRSLRRFVFQDDKTNKVSDTSNIMPHLTKEYQRMALAMRREFERDGIHLSYSKREEAREMNNTVVGLETLFTTNITDKKKYYTLTQDMAREVDKIVPRHILGQLVPGGDTKHGMTLSTDTLLTNTLLAHSSSTQLRKDVFLQSNTTLPENLKVLDSLIRYRHLHSTLLGYPSYAHRVLSDRMVGSPEKVMEFLSNMETRSKKLFQKEMELMLQTKRYVEGYTGSKIEPWDIPYYTTFIKNQRQQQRWNKEKDDCDYDEQEQYSQFSNYFTLENSIDGMKVLVQELFGITMMEVPIPIQERWDVEAREIIQQQRQESLFDGLSTVNKGGLRKFEFHHEDEPLGTMYFDLHPREGKFVHAAHFTIRCGRIRKIVPDDPTNNNHSHQLPIVALVCNLSPSSQSDGLHSKSLLSHSEVETLYHEFGHGLHSLLSRTSFQHLSGTRAAMDFVETPSHWMETFTRDPSFLSKVLARHYVTGIPMSERRARHLALSISDFRGVEVQTQIVHSKFDQALFGDNPCSPSLGGCTSSDAFEQLHYLAGLPFAKGTHWHSRFGHLVTYGAGYYGYLYAQTFAADIWTGIPVASDVSSSEAIRERGMKIWKEMLIHGGAKDPKEMLIAVLGREPSVDAFFNGFS